MHFEAIITDLDGTAVDSPMQKVASNRLRAAIQKLENADVKICAATGRPPSFAKPVIDSMLLTAPCIVAGGTRIIDPTTWEPLWTCDIEPDAAKQIFTIAKDMPYGALWNDYVESNYLDGGWKVDGTIDTSDLYFFEFCFVPHDEVLAVLKKFAHIDSIAATVVIAQRPGTNDIHITHKHATKEHAVAELLKMLEIDKTDTIGVGDGHNDLHLFNAVGHKVAMGNAVDELKQSADMVIGPVQNDGLAQYLEELIEEETI